MAIFQLCGRHENKRMGIFRKSYFRNKGRRKRGIQLFPFYSYERKERDTKFNILGPLYHESEWYIRDERFFHRRVAIVNRYFEEKDKTFLNVWPFFEYSSKKKITAFCSHHFFRFVLIISTGLLSLCTLSVRREKRGGKTW